MKTRYLYLIPIVSVLLSGCNDFLDRFPYDEVSSNTVYTSPTLAESAVIGAYSNIAYDYTSADLDRINWDAFAGVIDPHYDVFYSNYTYLNGNARPNNGIFSTYWKRLYEGINRANDVISNIGGVAGMDEDLKARRIAECRFLRAWHYYRLNCLWGGVPVYDRNLAPSEYTRGRSTQNQVWDFIIEDLTRCIETESLPDKYASSSADFGRITKGAAYALRGKVYMWKKMWAEAEADLRQVALCGYGLLKKDYANVFKLANETSDEIIFSARMEEQSGYGNAFSRSYGSWQVAGKGGNNTFFMNQKFVDSYQTADGKDFDWDDWLPDYSSLTPEQRSVYFLRDGMTATEIDKMAAYGADMSRYLPSGNESRLLAAFNARDPRLLATVITPYSKYSGGFYGSAKEYTRRWPFRDDNDTWCDIKTKANTNFFYTIRKFVTVGLECTNETFNPVDVPIIRYAEVLIDLAETMCEQNRLDEAVGYLNQVRERAGIGLYNSGDPELAVTDVQDLRNRIYNERRWELACEEVLYYDELRQGTWKSFRFSEGNGLCEPWGTPAYLDQWGGNEYELWPIPSSEAEMNRNLEQNPGWMN